ncbi:YojF family protein [Metabacillus halosaccharovorans]|uniref:YojF family protein n=1 Tax=Metabacillus halosaccharovorans TaxID=930124 RepID=UPI0009956125|nr:YojF family protein [Metabacillus halosaccharovorans]
MKSITKRDVQGYLNHFLNKQVFIHLETTTGSYSAHKDEKNMTVVAFIRNTKVTYHQAKITGNGPYRIGLKLEDGWIYAEGLTDWTFNEEGQLLTAGHNSEGQLAIALQISEKPFHN